MTGVLCEHFGTAARPPMADGDEWEIAPGVLARQVPGCGVAAFAAKEFQPGDVVFREPAMFISAVDIPSPQNAELYRALLAELHARRLSADFTPNAHLGALVALRDLGVAGCREFLRQKCHGEELPSAKVARHEAAPLRRMVAQGFLPSSCASMPALEYAKLRMAIQLNGFRFNLHAQEGDFGYDTGEVLFDKISRLNHSCAPNLEFNLTWDEHDATVVNTITASKLIAATEELNISYLPLRLNLSVKERREQLLKHWGFVCACPKCLAEGGPPRSPTPPAPVSAPVDVPRPALESGSESEGICWDDLCDPDECEGEKEWPKGCELWDHKSTWRISFGGKWPFWLSPRQCMVVPVSEDAFEYAKYVKETLHARGFHVEANLGDGTLNKKVREAQVAQFNYILVVGKDEEDQMAVNVRARGEKRPIGTKGLKEFMEELQDDSME
eukprot:s59_g56.t1